MPSNVYSALDSFILSAFATAWALHKRAAHEIGAPGFQWTNASTEDSLIVITNAIKTAFIDHPSSGHGTTWDQITKSDEESIHLAKAVLIALRKAGYSISKVEEENAPRP